MLRLKFELGMAIASVLFAGEGLCLRAHCFVRIGTFVIGMLLSRAFTLKLKPATGR